MLSRRPPLPEQPRPQGSRRPRTRGPSRPRGPSRRRRAEGVRLLQQLVVELASALVGLERGVRYVGTSSVSQATSTVRGRSSCHRRRSMFVNPTIAFPGPPSCLRIDFGSAWYARCANESPSTASSGLTTANAPDPDRIAKPLRRSPCPFVTRQRAKVLELDRRPVRDAERPEAASRSVPAIPAGTSSTPASSAMRAAPECQRASCRLTMPFRLRVPSGNMTTALPSRASATAVSSASSSRSPRRTRNPPPAVTITPRGNQKSSDFAMKRKNLLGKKGIASGHGSKFDQWFAASTKPRLAAR